MSVAGVRSDAPPLRGGHNSNRKQRHSDKSKRTTSLHTVSHALPSRTKSGQGRLPSLSVQLAKQHDIEPGGTPCYICKRSLSYGEAMERVCKCQLGRSCVHNTSLWQHLVCPISPRPLVVAGPSFRALNRSRKPTRAPCVLAAQASTPPAATPSAAAVPCGAAQLPTPLRNDAIMASVLSALPTTPVRDQRPAVLTSIAPSKPAHSLTQSPDVLLVWPQRQKRSSRTRRSSVLQLAAHSTTAEATPTSTTIRKRKRPHGRGTPKFCKACRQPMKGHSTLSCAVTNA